MYVFSLTINLHEERRKANKAMKYTIARQSPYSHKKYNVICNGKIAAKAKIKHSEQPHNQYK